MLSSIGELINKMFIFVANKMISNTQMMYENFECHSAMLQ
jgi:hypothetical protein